MPSNEFPLNKKVEVEWADATGNVGWRPLVDVEDQEAASCRSIGYLVFQNKERLTLAMTQGLNGDVCGSITIPTPWVKKVRQIK